MRRGIALGLAVAAAVSGARAAEPLDLAAERRVSSLPPGRDELRFSLPATPAGQQVRLSLDARVDWTDLAGFNPWMSLNLNGTLLRGPQLLNKPVDFTTRNGVDFVWDKAGLWTVLYSPDFSDTIRTQPMPWGFADTDPYHFVWDITPYAKAGENLLVITHAALLAQGTTLVLRDVRVEIGTPLPSFSGGEVKPAPEGPLPVYVAAPGPVAVAMDVTLSSAGAIRLRVGDRELSMVSRTSEPAGKWRETAAAGDGRPVAAGTPAEARWQGTGYSVTRQLLVLADHIRVTDTVANTTDKLLGVIYENRLLLPAAGGKPKVLLAGRPAIAETSAVEEPAHPSALVEWSDLAVGLFAEDDVFRIHVKSFSEPQAVGVADPRLGLAPGKAQTFAWSLYVAPQGDYWAVINAVRRDWRCNYTVPGPTLFDANTDGGQPQAYFDELVRTRGLKLVFSGQTDFRGDEIRDGVDLAEGTAIPLARRWCTSAAEWVKKLHAADPTVKAMVYLHPSICTEPEAAVKYADSKILAADGSHVTSPYRYPVYEYLSTLDSSYGKALFQTLQRILDEIGCDGIFVDEISGGSVPQYAFGATWDGCTVSIDPNTHAVVGQTTSVVLLEQPWKCAMVECLRQRGKLLVGNGPARTRTMLDWQMPMFTELGSYSFLIDMHLASPIALGNHDNDNDDRVRARMVRRALDYAGVVYGYSWGDRPQASPHYLQTMFPITPVELRPGMILGAERIVTNRSGRYGWSDGATGEVIVFGADGKRAVTPNVKTLTEGGRWQAEVRMPSDHFAVLVKAPAR